MQNFFEWSIDPIDIILSEEHDPYELLGIPQGTSYDNALPAFREKIRTYSSDRSKIVAINNLMDDLKRQKGNINVKEPPREVENPFRKVTRPYESPTKDIGDIIQAKVWDSPLLTTWSNKSKRAAHSLANMYKDYIKSKSHMDQPSILAKLEILINAMAKNGEEKTIKLSNRISHHEDIGKWIKEVKQKNKSTIDMTQFRANRPKTESFINFKQWVKNRNN